MLAEVEVEDVHLHVLEDQVDLVEVVMQDLVVYQVIIQKNVELQGQLTLEVEVEVDPTELVDQELL
tara:strand:- start:390 stop:587 length:198 start_codon:yes stop_codon:yes gene_type:complete